MSVAPVTSRPYTCIVLVLVLVLVLSSHVPLTSASRGKIGVDYGLNGDNLLTPAQTVALLHSHRIRRVRSYEARPEVTQAFAGAGIDLMVGVRNEEVPALAATLGVAFNWVTKYVVPFPTSSISAVSVGNEWLFNTSNDPSLLVPAMRNIYIALSTLQFDYAHLGGIKVSTSHAYDVLNHTFPPSTATFKEQFVAVMRAVVEFAEVTESFFMVNVVPYFAYLEDKGVSLEFALFEATKPVVTDPYTGLQYQNLFDMQVDAVYAAITSLLSSSPPSSSYDGAFHEHVPEEAANGDSPPSAPPVKVGESGWPSGPGDCGTPPVRGLKHILPSPSSNPDAHHDAIHTAETAQYEAQAYPCCACATRDNARIYNQNLIRHVLSATGTPAHPTTPIQAYIFEIFNEDLKPAGSEQHFGLFFPNGTAVYPIDFHHLGSSH